MFEQKRAIDWPRNQPPQLLVVVDTEEEFDWQGEPDQNATSVSAMRHIDRVQTICNDYGVVPCYVIDYPIASQPRGYKHLKALLARGQCEIGAHLHPWVNPPVEETLSPANTYPGNLSEPLEREKLKVLTDTIETNLGVRPVIYKAGRYGFGPNTGRILEELGYRIDLSTCPPLDSTADGGPDYSHHNAWPFWFGSQTHPILELPCTGAFVGWAGQRSPALYRAAQRGRRFRAPGVLARIGAVDRLTLSPEGFGHEEHIKLVRSLYQRGLRVFTWSFHSPSVVPGNTPYVQTETELERFLDRFRAFFDFFLNDLGGQATTPGGLLKFIKESEL